MLPGWLGVLDLALYNVAAAGVLLSFFDVWPRWTALLAALALPHYLADGLLKRGHCCHHASPRSNVYGNACTLSQMTVDAS